MKHTHFVQFKEGAPLSRQLATKKHLGTLGVVQGEIELHNVLGRLEFDLLVAPTTSMTEYLDGNFDVQEWGPIQPTQARTA